MANHIFITGIDTGVGKTYATGLWARWLLGQGQSVITTKLVQTGSNPPAEDIRLHRRLMGQELSDLDHQGLTCPYVFPYPASPHLAAHLAGREIDPARINAAFSQFDRQFDWVLIEGAGGVCVPLTREYTTLDFIKERRLRTVVVTSPKLGSINHTLLTLEVLQKNQVPVMGLVYNQAVSAPDDIRTDSLSLFRKRFFDLPVIELPAISSEHMPDVPDFALLTRGL